MRIDEIFTQKKPVISFEVFPPNSTTKINSIYQAVEKLATLKPDYISVTYGASGLQHSTNQTVNLAGFIKREYQIEPLAHLTCITATPALIADILAEMADNNIENILALRGDIPQGFNSAGIENQAFRHAIDLVRFIKQQNAFTVGAACHPEGHLEAKSKTMDLINLKQKVEGGVDFLVSQLFFDNREFYSFINEVRLLGIAVPITAGIMPVINTKQIERIVSLCGARVPEKFKRIMTKYEHNREALRDAGIAYASEQIIDLLSAGVDGVHMYVMNRPDIARRLIDNISSVVRELNSQSRALTSAD